MIVYDKYHNGGQYLLVGTSIDPSRRTTASLYFATAAEPAAGSTGLTWTNWQEVLSGPTTSLPGHPAPAAFDYGSIAVDSAGRVIVGAVRKFDNQQTNCADGFWVRIGTWNTVQGAFQFADPSLVAIPKPDSQGCLTSLTKKENRWGIGSRAAAAGNQFYVFAPTLSDGDQFQPSAVSYYSENGSGVWSGDSGGCTATAVQNGLPNDSCASIVHTFDAPLNNPPANSHGDTNVFYAPLLDVAGNASGKWAVTFQKRISVNPQDAQSRYNNVVVCTNQPPQCIVVNPTPDDAPNDQFMNAVAVDPDGGIWVTYLTYKAPGRSYVTQRTELVKQHAVHIGGTTIQGMQGIVGTDDIDAKMWFATTIGYRCIASCYAMGDYAKVAGNPERSRALSAPYVNGSRCRDFGSETFCSSDDLFQFNVSISPQFTPRPTIYSLGSDIRVGGGPNPPETLGVAPEKGSAAHGEREPAAAHPMTSVFRAGFPEPIVRADPLRFGFKRRGRI